MSRTLRGILFVSLFGTTMALGGASFAADAAGKCKLAKEGSPLWKACSEGGIKAAKAEMKKMLKAAKAKGMKADCDSCHSDEAAYDKLTADGKKKFDELLALIK